MRTWDRFVGKAERDRELALMAEATEKTRHQANIAIASVGVYLALVAVGAKHAALDAALALSLAVSTLRCPLSL
mgnify:CR=1 FL=1